MENTITDENLIKRGKMNKNPMHMSPDELALWEEQMDKDIREYLFSIGQPLVYRKNGQMIIEYADGSIENAQ